MSRQRVHLLASDELEQVDPLGPKQLGYTDLMGLAPVRVAGEGEIGATK